MGLQGMPPDRSCRRHFLVLRPEHLTDRVSPGGSGRMHADRTLRSPTAMSSSRHNGRVWFETSNRAPTSCPARGQMSPKTASLPANMTGRWHQRESHVCIFLNRIPT